MGSADVKGPDIRNTPRDPEARAALDLNLARQREVAGGKRDVNTQGRDSIALSDEKNTKPELDDQPGWLP
jgi:hypothetical protein